MSDRLSSLVVAVLVSAAASGCSHWGKHHRFPWQKEEPQTPDKVVAMWTNTVLSHPDGPATRGFGGRLMFYREPSPKPVLVDGTLIVYGFDETRRKPDDPRPDRKYVFTPEQFAHHYSKSDIGHSYSVWLPWDDADGPPRKVSLIVRFIPREGPLLLGEQSTHLLPGPGPSEADAKHEPDPKDPRVDSTSPASAEAQPNPVRAVSYQGEIPRPLPGANPAASRQRTTTIEIPVQSRLYRGASSISTPAATPQPAGVALAAAPQVAPKETSAPAAKSGAVPTLPRTGFYGIQRSRPLGQPIAAPRPGFGAPPQKPAADESQVTKP